jgi:DNA-binding beta-propeller fold protein YncE
MQATPTVPPPDPCAFAVPGGHVAATRYGRLSRVGVAVSPGGTHVYVTNDMFPGTVSVICGE